MLFRKSILFTLVLASIINFAAADSSKKCRSSRIPIIGTEAEIVCKDGSKANIKKLHQKGHDLEQLDFQGAETIYLRDNKTGIIVKHQPKGHHVSSSWLKNKQLEFNAQELFQHRASQAQKLLEKKIKETRQAGGKIPYAPSQIIIGFKEYADFETIYNTIESINGIIIKELLLKKTFTILLDESTDIFKLSRDIQKNDCVEFSHPNWYMSFFSVPRSESIFVEFIDLQNAWAFFDLNNNQIIDTNEESLLNDITIAIIDSGIDYNHEDLQENIWINELELNGIPDFDDDLNGFVDDIKGWDFVFPANNDPMDTHSESHGTAVAGIASAVADNNKGLAGTAWGAKLMPLKAGTFLTGPSIENSIDSVIYAADNGADVINMSYGGNTLYGVDSYRQAIDYAFGKGCVLIAAIGNTEGGGIDISENSFYPANFDNVISVGALAFGATMRASYSNWGTTLDISSPGTDLYSTLRNDQYTPYPKLDGTSVAAPVVSGVVALMRAAAPNHTNTEIMKLLRSSQVCDDLGTSNWDQETGWGRIDAYKAVKSVIAEITPVSIGHGSISPDEKFWVERGSSFLQPQTFTADPDEGYQVDYWKVYYSDRSETIQTTSTTYIHPNVTEDIAVYAVFKEKDDGPDPFSDLIVTQPAASPYQTGDDDVRFTLRLPDNTAVFEYYNHLRDSGETFNIDGTNEWSEKIRVSEGTNPITFTAKNGSGSILATASFTVIRKENVISIHPHVSECATVASGRDTRNFGGSVSVGYDQAPEWECQIMRGLVKFDLNIPDNCTIIDAQLKAEVNTLNQPGSDFNVTIYRLVKDWSEDDVNWNNLIGRGDTYHDNTVNDEATVGGQEDEVYWSATEIVNSWYGGVDNYGFILFAESQVETDEINRSRDFEVDAFRLLIKYEHEINLPSLIISTPNDGHTVENSITNLTISGTASDDTDVGSIAWKNNTTSDTGTASGTTSWNFAVNLVVGENRITVTARDIFGNVKSEAITITRSEPDTTPPGNATNCSTIPYPESILISWQEPSSSDFAGVVILRSEDTVNATMTNGSSYTPGDLIGNAKVISAGASSLISDSGLDPYVSYYYRIYAYDNSYNYASGVELFGVPLPQPDVSDDTVVDFADYSLLAEKWATDCNELNSWCDGSDIDHSGLVDIADLGILADHWLDGAMSGHGTEASPYIIEIQDHLERINDNPAAHYKLANDIDLAGHIYNEAVITTFTGVFDGDGHVIRNLAIEPGSSVGLFGHIIDPNSVVMNLGLQDPNSIEGFMAGSLCGQNRGKIDNCYVIGAVVGINSTSSVRGALCGRNIGTGIISKCFAMGTIQSGGINIGGFCGENLGGTINDCYAEVAVNGNMNVGGFCGRNAGTIVNCYSTGLVNGGSTIGGFCGNSSGSIINSYWDINTSKIGSPGNNNFGAIGKSTSDMGTQSTYINWDFVNIWKFTEGASYPLLRQENVVEPDGIVFASIPEGTFQMGDSFSEGELNELPVHTVTLGSFDMSKHEITNGQYAEFLNSAYPREIKVDNDGSVYAISDSNNHCPYFEIGNINSYSQIEFSGGAFSVKQKNGRDMTGDPAILVSWYGAKAFCDYYGYRLPTEAEWEYAARGGLSGNRFPWGDTINHNYANYRANGIAWDYDSSPYTDFTLHPTWDDGASPCTAPVGSFPANGYGLYDIIGNVSEWCADWYGDYPSAPQIGPAGPATGTYRVIRLGSYYDNALRCRIARRMGGRPEGVFYPTNGFRVCR